MNISINKSIVNQNIHFFNRSIAFESNSTARIVAIGLAILSVVGVGIALYYYLTSRKVTDKTKETVKNSKIVDVVKVKISGSGENRSIEISINDTIAMLKQKLQNVSNEKISVEQMKLFFKGKALDDHKTLKDYQITTDGKSLLLRLRQTEKNNEGAEEPKITEPQTEFGTELKNLSGQNKQKPKDAIKLDDFGAANCGVDDKAQKNGENLAKVDDVGGVNLKKKGEATIPIFISIIPARHVKSSHRDLCPLSVSLDWTVEDLKKTIEKQLKVPVADYILIFESKVLKDGKTLRDCNLMQSSSIQCVKMKHPIDPKKREITLSIKQFVGPPITIKATEDETVHEIKQKIAIQGGVSPFQIGLLLDGDQLDDSKTLGEYGITENSYLVSVKKLGVLK